MDKTSEIPVENNESTTEKKLGGVTGKGFMPGRSGNPGGRPRTTVLTDAYKGVLEMSAAAILGPEALAKLRLPEDASMAEAIAQQMALAAIGGSVKAASQIGDRTEGRPAQPLNIKHSEFDDRTNEDLEYFANHGYWPDQSGSVN